MTAQHITHQTIRTEGPRKDPPRREAMRRVKVRFRPELLQNPRNNAQTVVAGQIVRQSMADKDGWIELTVYESDLDRVREKVISDDDRALLEVAERAYWNRLHKEMRETLGGDRGLDFDIPDDPADYDEQLHRVWKKFGHSPESQFYEMNDRGVPPLAEMKVSKEKLPPPLSEHEQSVAQVAERMGGQGVDAQALAAAMVEAMTKAGWKPPSSSK